MEIKGCRAPRSCSSQAIVCHIGRSRDAGVDGRGGRAEINFFKLFGKPLLPHYGFHDSAPLECRLPWKPSLGPLLGWMSGLLSLERLWRGERWECFEDGLHFCSAFSRRIFFFFCSPLCGAVPRWEISFRAAPGARGTRLQLAHEHPKSFWQREQKQQHRQGSKMRYHFPFWLHSAGAPRACSPLSSMHFWHCLNCFPFRVQFGDWANWESFEPAPSSTSPRALTTLLVSSVKTWCMCKCHHSSSSRSLPGLWADRVRMSPAAARKDGVGKICPVCMSCREFLSQPNPLGSVTPNT